MEISDKTFALMIEASVLARDLKTFAARTQAQLGREGSTAFGGAGDRLSELAGEDKLRQRRRAVVCRSGLFRLLLELRPWLLLDKPEDAAS